MKVLDHFIKIFLLFYIIIDNLGRNTYTITRGRIEFSKHNKMDKKNLFKIFHSKNVTY